MIASAKCTDGTPVPEAALRKMSASQRSYLDEFTFRRIPDGGIEGWYAGELLASWDGIGWWPPRGGHKPSPPAEIGEIIGGAVIRAHLPRDATRRQRVTSECLSCGLVKDEYVANMLARRSDCTHTKEARSAAQRKRPQENTPGTKGSRQRQSPFEFVRTADGTIEKRRRA